MGLNTGVDLNQPTNYLPTNNQKATNNLLIYRLLSWP
jgi:hypothetical protein